MDKTDSIAHTVQCLYFAGQNFRNFREFDGIRKNISIKFLKLCTITCFYSVFTKFFNEIVKKSNS